MDTGAEAELITRCRRGDAAAWDALFDLHYAPTGRFLFQLAPEFTPEDVEELCQEVFLAVIKHLVNFQGNSRLQTWIFRSATNKARDHREKLRTAKRGSGRIALSLNAEDPETGLTLDPPSVAPAPDAQLLRAEQAALLHGALGQLGEPCREIIELRY